MSVHYLLLPTENNIKEVVGVYFRRLVIYIVIVVINVLFASVYLLNLILYNRIIHLYVSGVFYSISVIAVMVGIYSFFLSYYLPVFAEVVFFHRYRHMERIQAVSIVSQEGSTVILDESITIESATNDVSHEIRIGVGKRIDIITEVEMHNKQEWKELLQSIQVYLRWAVASLLDAGFLTLWIITQWVVNTYIIKRIELSGIDQWMLNIFQILFAIATLIPIISYVIKDAMIIIFRTWRTIRKEMNHREETQLIATDVIVDKEVES